MNDPLKVEKVGFNIKVTEADGTVRILPPLYFQQMTYRGADGHYHYERSVPENYFGKRDFLTSRGWRVHGHYDSWRKGEYKEQKSFTTDQAIMQEGEIMNNKGKTISLTSAKW